MTTTPPDTSREGAGKPPVVDLPTWQAARDQLLVREKAHTREGDAIAAARRRLPMVEIDGSAEVVGAEGPVPFVDLFRGRDELVVYHSMWYDGAPSQGQCEGCTFNVWHLKDTTVYLDARGVSSAVLTSGAWNEVAPYVEFMGYRVPWFSVRGVEARLLTEEGHFICYLRDGDRVYMTYSTTGRGNEPADGVPRAARHDALRPPGRVGRKPRGLARGLRGRWGRRARRAHLLVLAHRRRWRRRLGADEPTDAAVDPPRRDPGGHLGTAGRSGDDVTARYTFDIFSTLDSYGSFGADGDWGGYWGKQGPELIERRSSLFDDELRMVFGANTFRQVEEMLGSSADTSGIDAWNLRMRDMPATVISSTLQGARDWPNATIVRGDAVDAVARLKQESDVPLRSIGSLSLNWALMAAGLVDLVHVTIFPVISGATGTEPIFEGAADFDLELVESQTLDGRTQELIYRPTLH